MRALRTFVAFSLASVILCPLHAQRAQTVLVDASAPAAPFSHFWEQMFGSGRAILSLRESYRDDLHAVKKVTALKYVRFHGIFLDEVGLYSEDKQGRPQYNFTYIDQIYDGLLENGVRPFVEISFMPRDLAARPDEQGFWYKPIVAPPKDYARWDELITQFARHLVDRYGIDEVSKWYFEVWNEPNIGFWTGTPPQESYFELYDHTALDLKNVSPRLRVGGPSTAQAAWIKEFIAHTVEEQIPVDFISSHIYGMDQAKKVFGPGVMVPEAEMVYRGVKKMHDDIASSPRPNLPLIVSEFSAGRVATGQRDTIYMGPWLANVIRETDGLAAMISFWPFSDVFEEHGVPDAPFTDQSAREGRGLITPDGIPKPSYVAFALLHRLGDQRIWNANSNVIVTRRRDGALIIALWNLTAEGEAGKKCKFDLEFRHIPDRSQAVVYRLDSAHEDTLAAYRAMGDPRYPTRAQIEKLWQVAQIRSTATLPIEKGSMIIGIPSDGLAIVEVRAQH
jgi:xylan 1,4-beta-xylosidase